MNEKQQYVIVRTLRSRGDYLYSVGRILHWDVVDDEPGAIVAIDRPPSIDIPPYPMWVRVTAMESIGLNGRLLGARAHEIQSKQQIEWEDE